MIQFRSIVGMIKIRTGNYSLLEVTVALVNAGYDLKDCQISPEPFTRTGTLPIEYDWDVMIMAKD